MLPAIEITFPLNTAFMGRSFLTSGFRACIGFGATLRELPVLLEDAGLRDPNLYFGGAMMYSL